VKQAVEFADERGIDVEPGEVGVERFEEVAAGGVDRIRVGDPRVEAALGRDHPAAGRHLGRAVGGGGDGVPEPVEVGAGAGEPSGHADDRDALGGVGHSIRSCSCVHC
jgi:hypothetical protein